MNLLTVKNKGIVATVGVLLFFFLVRFFFLQIPLKLDEAMLQKSWQSPYLLRLPATILLVIFVIAGWIKEQTPVPLESKTKGQSWLDSRVLYFSLVLLVFVTCRWFSLAGGEMNPDESQSIVAARTLLKDPRFWISVDIGTHGPVVSLSQTILPLLGISIDHAGSRLLGMGMMIGGILSGFVLLRRVATESSARLLLLPLLFLVAALDTADMVAYNGEHPLIFFILLSVALVTRSLLPQWEESGTDSALYKPDSLSLLLGGIALGIVPWVKLQGVPFVVFFFILSCAGCFLAPLSDSATSRKQRVGLVLTFCLGLLLPSVVVLLWVLATGAFMPMIRSYILWSIAYANRYREDFSHSASRLSSWLKTFLTGSTLYHSALQLMIGLGVLGVVLNGLSRRRWNLADTFAGSALLWVLVSCFCILKPGNQFDHYLLLAVFPLGLFMTFLWASLLQKSPQLPPLHPLLSKRNVGMTLLTLGVIGPLILWGGDCTFLINASGRERKLTAPFHVIPTVYPDIHQELSQELPRVTLPGEYIVVWGFCPSLFVKTDTLSATRSAIAIREAIHEQPDQPYFYQLYLDDFKRNKPVAFVDTLNPKDIIYFTYNEMRKINTNLPRHDWHIFQHENYWEITKIVESDYQLYFTETTTGGRIYLRKDRFAEVVACQKRHGVPCLDADTRTHRTTPPSP